MYNVIFRDFDGLGIQAKNVQLAGRNVFIKVKKLPYGVQIHFSDFVENMVKMTWQEVQMGADKGAIVLLPIGIVEGHGPHLDLSADFYLSTLNCRFLKQELEGIGIEALIAPPFYWEISKDMAIYTLPCGRR